MTGWRAGLGCLIPPGTPTVEREMSKLAPEGVSVHFARMVARGPVGTLQNLQQRAASQLEHMQQTVKALASVEPDVMVHEHTATSYVPFISALRGAVAAFEALGVRRVAVGTPYDQALPLRGKAVLEEYGIDVFTDIFKETPCRVYSSRARTAPTRKRCSSAVSDCRPSERIAHCAHRHPRAGPWPAAARPR